MAPQNLGTATRAAEIRELRARLAEAEQTLDAIRDGNVDALVVYAQGTERIYTLQGADSSYQALVEAMQQGALIVSGAGLILYANRSFAAMLKAPLEKIIGSLVYDGFAVGSQNTLRELLRQGATTADGQELSLSASDGTAVPMLISVTPSSLHSEPFHSCLIATDLTDIYARKHKEADALKLQIATAEKIIAERQLAEAALRESERRFHLMANSAPVLIWLSGPDRLFTWVNDVWLTFTGRTLDQEMGDGWTSGLHPDDLQRSLSNYSSALDARIAFSNEYRLRRHDGVYRWVLDRGVPRFDGQSRFLGFIGCCVDITDRKAAEEALRKSEERIRLSEAQMLVAQQISGTGSWLYSLETQKIKVTPEARHIFGYAALSGDFPIEQFEGLIPERERVHQALLDLIAQVRVYDLEYVIKPADGSPPRTVHSIAKLEMDEQHKPALVVGFVQDITERKQLEDQVQQLALHDPLTGLPNRRLLMDRLTRALVASKRSRHHGALLFLDMDNFKPLNDAHGHQAGDLLLMEVARRLKSCVREIDVVSRFGGDEFVVLLADLDGDEGASAVQAGVIAEKIREKLGEPYVLDMVSDSHEVTHVQHRCTASIGYAVFEGMNASVEDIIKKADAAMYEAKEAGRNRVRAS